MFSSLDVTSNFEGVRESRELARVRDLPWFDPLEYGAEAARVLTARLRVPGGTRELRPIQGAALATAIDIRGGFFPMRTGAGKSDTSLLLASLFPEVERPLILVPASREAPTHEHIRFLRKHYKVKNHIVLSYERLSQKQNVDIFERIRPDLVIADEAHKLKDSSGSRWRRLKRYAQKSTFMFFAMSGTFSRRSVLEYWHIQRLALGQGSFLPLDPIEAAEWDRALNHKVLIPLAPGALLSLAPGQENDGVGYEAARKRYGRRMISTKGVVSSGHDVPDFPLKCSVLREPATPKIEEVAKHLRENWETPCGYVFDLAVDLWRHEREASLGLYKRWRVEPPKAWLSVRREWSKYLRTTISHSHRLDTPSQVIDAIQNGTLPDGVGILEAWRKIEPTYTPDTVSVWVCDSTLELVAAWLEEKKGIAWVTDIDFGNKLSKLTRLPYFRENACDSNGVHIERSKGPIIASVNTCGVGQNLQGIHFRNLIVTCPDSALLEQTVSRTHRDGLVFPHVEVEFLQRLPSDAKALELARRDAEGSSDTMQASQRLTIAEWIVE